jgi:hypothetical protein
MKSPNIGQDLAELETPTAGNPGYRLESAGQLVTGPWGPATETILPGDDFNQAKLAPGTESRFYRLKKP